MYPDFHFLFLEVFGVDIPALSLLKTFGFLVAMAFLVGSYVIYLELKRKEKDGLVTYSLEEVIKGKPASAYDYIVNILVGFLIGYKFLGMFMDREISSPDPMNYLFSGKGFLLGGIVLAALSFYLKYTTSKKESAEGERKVLLKTWPHTRVGDVAVIAAVGGFAGAKIFNALETWDDFIRDPLGSLFSSSGLTFYGGLIVATIALWYFSRKIKLDFRHLCDAAAPALILAYGIGRLGCQVSGDGDWGIYNSAFQTNAQGQVVEATVPFDSLKMMYADHLSRHFAVGDEIPHINFPGIAGLPQWLLAYNYPNNVNNVGVALQECSGDYCAVLPIPVFPTPLYEFIVCTLLFFLLWAFRKKMKVPLTMFGVYLILNGLERFFVEKIRVNYKYDWGIIHPTQAEIISTCLIIFGIILLLVRKRIDTKFEKE